jgi:hypothetical protein
MVLITMCPLGNPPNELHEPTNSMLPPPVLLSSKLQISSPILV